MLIINHHDSRIQPPWLCLLSRMSVLFVRILILQPCWLHPSFLLFSTHTPNSLQILSFSSGLIDVANPLVVVPTNTLAPPQPSGPFTMPMLSDSACQPYLNSPLVMFRPFLTLQIASQMLFPTRHT